MRVKLICRRYIDTKAIGLEGAPERMAEGAEFDVPDECVEAFQRGYGKPGRVYEIVADKPAAKAKTKGKE